MTYDHWANDLVQGIEAVGVGIMVVGGSIAFVRYAFNWAARQPTAYKQVRQALGRSLQLGLEVLIVADIVRTVVVEPTLSNVAVLGAIVTIRIVLSWSLDLEVNGTLPWQRPPPPT